MQQSTDLQNMLHSIHRKSYPAYKSLKGAYQFGHYILSVDHVQGDPFASPSHISIRVSHKTAGFPEEYLQNPVTKITLCDYLTRQFEQQINRFSFRAKGSGKSGLISVSHCGQEVLKRTACEITDQGITARFFIGFPANGRTVNSVELEKILFDFLPICVQKAFLYKNLDAKKLEEAIFLAEDQAYIREQLKKEALAAFVADGAILPRESGISSHPMKDSIPFQSPDTLRVTMTLPHKGKITGMGIPEGITLIVGGGYHGKSTLLNALELGVYNHVPGDGREYVVTNDTALKLRSEDGRFIKDVDISLFINDLPNKKDTSCFSTEDASGSTSQAANVIEAMEADTSLFLIDEDTSATNFMIRDELMQRVVHRENEPITPFIERVRHLYESQGISSIIVAGSSGSYFHVADHILQMDRYIPKDITSFAKDEAKAFPAVSLPAETLEIPAFHRCFIGSKELKNNRRVKLKPLGKDAFSLNKETVDLRYLEQLVDAEQTAALGYALLYAQLHLMNGKRTLRETVDALFERIEQKGLSIILDSRYVNANLALPRKQEVFGCLNRYRKL